MTSRNLNLTANNINTRHLFSNCVLYLDAWIDFDKINVFLLINQEFNRARIAIAHMACNGQGIFK